MKRAKILAWVIVFGFILIISKVNSTEAKLFPNDRNVTSVFMFDNGTILTFNLNKNNSIYNGYHYSWLKEFGDTPFSIEQNIYVCAPDTKWLCFTTEVERNKQISVAIPNYGLKSSAIVDKTEWCFNGYLYKTVVRRDRVIISRKNAEKNQELVFYEPFLGIYKIGNLQLVSPRGIFGHGSEPVEIKQAWLTKDRMKQLFADCP